MIVAVPFFAVLGAITLLEKSRAKNSFMNVERPKERFKDIAGIDESMVEIQEVLSFLKSPGQHGSLGGRAPRGVLLVGPPGTGKTLLAKALAGESGASFITATGSEFVEMYVGVGAARVRQKFALARAHSPAIIFIDEFDSVGGKRMESSDGGAQEHLQTINALLAEMDGFHNGEPVIVVAATNRVEALDPAVLRPGRFDRKVNVDLPDTLGRESILQIHAAKVRLGPDADLRQIAAPARTGGMSGAFLANIVNEAANMAERRGAKAIAMKDLLEASDRESMGQARSLVMSPEQKRLTAYHEAGHALVQLALGGTVEQATIIPRGNSGGHVRSGGEEPGMISRGALKKRLAMSLGGLVAEQMLSESGDDHTTGPSSDLEKATEIAEAMVHRFGMGERTGSRVIGAQPGVDRSQRLLRNAELDVKDILAEAEATARRVLRERSADWEKLAQGLLAEETLTGEQIDALLEKPAPAAAAPAAP